MNDTSQTSFSGGLSPLGSSFGGARLRIVLILVAIAAIGLLAARGWAGLYVRYLERTPPTVEFVDAPPRGVGILPFTSTLLLRDDSSGLDEVIVRIQQRNVTKEILRRSFNGEREARIPIDFAGEKSGFEEGTLTLDIRAFDRSLWSNSAERSLELLIDYRKPRIEPVTVMHNVRRGGSQLALYRVTDQAIATSGVRVGRRFYEGFAASGVSEDFQDKSISAVLYAIPIEEQEPNPEVRMTAQDVVGNSASTHFPERVLPRPDRTLSYTIPDDVMNASVAELADSALVRLRKIAASSDGSRAYTTPPGTRERQREQFAIVNEELRAFNERELDALSRRKLRFEVLWDGPFLQPNAVVNAAFGDTVQFRNNNEKIGSTVMRGYYFYLRDGGEVVAVNDGVVSFIEEVGLFGTVLGIDHGLGLVSLYGNLDRTEVSVGASVKAGDSIARAGKLPFTRNPGLYFEMRVQGTPVDPREWWDKSWYHGHITNQIAVAKRLLEIPITKELQEQF